MKQFVQLFYGIYFSILPSDLFGDDTSILHVVVKIWEMKLKDEIFVITSAWNNRVVFFNSPLVAYTFAKRAATTMKRNAVTIKQDILRWCQINTQEYEVPGLVFMSRRPHTAFSVLSASWGVVHTSFGILWVFLTIYSEGNWSYCWGYSV